MPSGCGHQSPATEKGVCLRRRGLDGYEEHRLRGLSYRAVKYEKRACIEAARGLREIYRWERKRVRGTWSGGEFLRIGSFPPASS